MREKLKKIVINIFALIGILSTLAGLVYTFVEIYDRFSKPNIEAFKKDIYLTDTNINTGLIDFLKRNDGKTVYIDNFIDTSLVTEENWIVKKQCDVDIDAVIEKKIKDTPLLLPDFSNIDNLICVGNYLVLDIGNNTTYKYGSGGTGIVTVRFKGFFEVSTTYHSGPSIYYNLQEIEVPYEVREKIIS